VPKEVCLHFTGEFTFHEYSTVGSVVFVILMHVIFLNLLYVFF